MFKAELDMFHIYNPNTWEVEDQTNLSYKING